MATEFDLGEPGVRDLFDSYDSFLAILGSASERERLENLSAEQSQDDDLFKRTRTIGTRFQNGLTNLFFEADAALKAASQRYGVF